MLPRSHTQTRLRKLDDEVVDATLLAYAGLKRMDMTEFVTTVRACVCGCVLWHATGLRWLEALPWA